MKPKSFDPEKTLQVIAGCFAKSGYEGTSLEDITKKTGLGKQSLYNTFGDKKAMLSKSLGCSGKSVKSYEALENQKLSGRERIETFFAEILKESAQTSDPGCLVMNLLMEKSDLDRDVSKIVSQKWELTRTRLLGVVEAGVLDKSIQSKTAPDLISYALMNLLNGIRVTLRATDDPSKTKEVMMLGLAGIL